MADNIPLQHIHESRQPDREDGADKLQSESPLLHARRSLSSTSNQDAKGEPNKRNTIEKPKRVVKKDRKLAFYRFLLFHLIPIGVAVGLVALNIKTHFFGYQNRYSYLFQWVAKIHEVLMQLSIGTALIDYIQFLLTDSPAVPFGAIFSAFQSSSMAYLFSPDFYAAITASGFVSRWRLVFVVFIPLSTILATAVGPSSAEAMQPRNVNFTLPEQYYAFNISHNALYKTSLDSQAEQLGSSSNAPSQDWEYLQKLPVIGSDYSIQRGLHQEIVHHPNDDEYTLVMPAIYSVQTDVTPGSTIYTDVSRTIYVQYAPNGTMATVQHFPVALALGSTQDSGVDSEEVVTKKSTYMPQPYVSTICQPNFITGENDTEPIQFPSQYIAGCTWCSDPADTPLVINTPDLINYTGITRPDLWNSARNTSFTHGQMIWLDDLGSGLLGVILIQPDLCHTSNKTFLTTSACVVGSHWGNTTSYLKSSSGPRDTTPTLSIESHLSTDSFINIPDWSSAPINISKTWASSLDSRTEYQNQTVADNLLRSLLVTDNICPSDGKYGNTSLVYDDPTSERYPTERPYMHEALISSLLANGLSRSADPWELYQKHESHWIQSQVTVQKESLSTRGQATTVQSTPPGPTFTLHGELVGWAWNLNGASIKVALAVLLFYCLYAVVYVVFTLVSKRNAGAWGTMSSMTALAMRSTPPRELEGTCAGVEKVDTLRQMVGVREVEESGCLELVFIGDGNRVLRRVSPGKRYG